MGVLAQGADLDGAADHAQDVVLRNDLLRAVHDLLDHVGDAVRAVHLNGAAGLVVPLDRQVVVADLVLVLPVRNAAEMRLPGASVRLQHHALHAQRLIMMTDVAGILRDKEDPATLIRELSVPEAVGLFREGVIAGGMIPKVDCCIEAIGMGVEKVIIMDGRVPHSILMELLTDEGAGTLVKGE